MPLVNDQPNNHSNEVVIELQSGTAEQRYVRIPTGILYSIIIERLRELQAQDHTNQARQSPQYVTAVDSNQSHPAVISSIICAICQNEITTEQLESGSSREIATLDRCGHHFHLDCLTLWDMPKSEADCPSCRDLLH